ncbi:unnamed protein product [Adineta ricciae]|uniref:Uncharacterized protein n=1 Tax=Adineta ricciae TaxID=249248 RepID=A0A813SPB0_ADIRI|nr:unnamed protein product [Adineta ricciae]CAF0983234.1 unnamed protein product [Adineta ricciae]
MTRYHNGSLIPTTLFGSTCGASTLLVGETRLSGNDSLHLFNPQDITLNEDNGFDYVADTFNHRILRYSFGSPMTTDVAGGNGAGIGANFSIDYTQLNEPYGIYVSKNTSTFYIADTVNNRIVRWRLGQSTGMTIEGDCNGMVGTASSLLNVPLTLTMDSICMSVIQETIEYK